MSFRITCPYQDQTEHGFGTVDIFGNYCEVGGDCLKCCEYSYDPSDENVQKEIEANLKEEFPEFF